MLSKLAKYSDLLVQLVILRSTLPGGTNISSNKSILSHLVMKQNCSYARLMFITKSHFITYFCHVWGCGHDSALENALNRTAV